MMLFFHKIVLLNGHLAIAALQRSIATQQRRIAAV
jgi:hypothetical protein